MGSSGPAYRSGGSKGPVSFGPLLWWGIRGGVTVHAEWISWPAWMDIMACIQVFSSLQMQLEGAHTPLSKCTSRPDLVNLSSPQLVRGGDFRISNESPLAQLTIVLRSIDISRPTHHYSYSLTHTTLIPWRGLVSDPPDGNTRPNPGSFTARRSTWTLLVIAIARILGVSVTPQKSRDRAIGYNKKLWLRREKLSRIRWDVIRIKITSCRFYYMM